jgi:serine/threonine protein kinase
MIGNIFLNRYAIEAEIGKGGMGVVFRAKDQILNRFVAIKILKPSEIGTQGRARFLNEAQAAASLNHPNIVSVFDAGELDQTAFIIMELLEGDSLLSLKGHSVKEIIHPILQVCSALEHAHEHSIIHRDLKPENILITSDNKVKLTDFGLSRSTSSRLTLEGTIVGTVFYMSPEQALGKDIDGRADLYSLGIMLYELLTSRLPFTANDPLAVISQQLYSPVIPPKNYNSDIPDELEVLVLELLSKNPDNRPQTASIVKSRLISILEGLDKLSPQRPNQFENFLNRGALVARDREFSEAKLLWNSSSSGASPQTLLLITGESGVGKTALIREIMVYAEITGAIILKSQCFAEGISPFMPFADVIRNGIFTKGNQSAGQIFRELFTVQLSDMVLADLALITPDIRLALPELPFNPSLDPNKDQARLFDSVVAFFTQLQLKSPVLLIIEEGHWADSGTVFLLRHLIRRIKSSNLRILVLISYQESDFIENHPLNFVFQDLYKENLIHRIKLSRFNLEETKQVLENLLKDQIDPTLVEAIFQETEGNLYFIEEVVAALIENGELILQDHLWKNKFERELKLPQSIRETIQERFSRLPENNQEILRIASVIGREFDFKTLNKACSLDEDILISVLEDSVKRQIIQEVPGKSGEAFLFVHGVYATTLRESISNLRRHRLHRKIALAIDEVNSLDFSSIAFHLAEAHDIENACQNYIKAGIQAVNISAIPDAIRFYSQAINLTPQDSPDLFDLLLERFRLNLFQNNQKDCLNDARSILELANIHNLPSRQCDGLICLAEYYNGIDPSKASATAREAAAIAHRIGDSVREAKALLSEGFALRTRGDLINAKKVLEIAADRFQCAGMISDQAACFHTLALVQGDLGQKGESLKTANLALDLSRQVKNRQQEATSLRRIAIALENLGQLTEALPYAQSALEIHRDLGDKEQEVHDLNVLGIIYSRLKNFTQAEAYFSQSISTAESGEYFTGITYGLTNLVGMVYRARGDLEKGILLLQSEIKKLEPIAGPYITFNLEKNNFDLLIRFGQFQDCLDQANQLLAKLGDQLNNPERAFLFITIGRAYIGLNKLDIAFQFCSDALDLLKFEESPGLKNMAYIFRAYIHFLIDDPESLEQAIGNINSGLQQLPDEEVSEDKATSLIYLAYFYFKKGEIGEAEEKLNSSLIIWDDLPFPIVEVLFIKAFFFLERDKRNEAIMNLSRAIDWIHLVSSRTKNEDMRQGWLQKNSINRLSLIAWEQLQHGKKPNFPKAKEFRNE